MASENRFYLSVTLILISIVFDGIDGRIARSIKGSSKFGEQMDSLSDFVNFGVVPSFIVYSYILNFMGEIGWISIVIYSLSSCFRLARFNSNLKKKKKVQKWKNDYFLGVPAPCGGFLILLPVYLGFLGIQTNNTSCICFCIYTIFISYLTISNIPVWNGKSLRLFTFCSRKISLQLFLIVYIIFLILYIWQTLVVSSFAYLLMLPFSAYKYKKREKLENNKKKLKM